LLSAYLLLLKLGGTQIGQRPLLLVAVLALITGVQLFCFGLLAELQMRTYHESQGRPIYRVRETLRGALASG
jgi:dolichol-phosphate mannosyltransferase